MTNQSTINKQQSTIKRVLIVDDSLTAREYLKHIINKDENLSVVAMARDGQEAVSLVRQNHPDVVTMDIHMPRMDGYEATRKIMEIHPVPVVIVSSTRNPRSVEKTFQAMQAGAVASIEKPKGPGHPDADRMIAELIKTVKLMSEVKVVRRFAKYAAPKSVHKISPKAEIRPQPGQIELVAIGASTGGPPVIRTILSGLSGGFPFPILIVQHIASGFLQGMVEWLGKETPFPVQIPANGERVMGGKVYFAPDGYHMGVTARGEIVLSNSSKENGLRPAVSYLFRSVAKTYGQRAMGVLLTGMGKDGALELKEMKKKGAITIAQDKESSVVFGMPAEAVKLGAADYILAPEEIARFLTTIKKGSS